MLQLPAKRYFGRLVNDSESIRSAVILEEEPTADSPALYLRFALVLQGLEWPVLPATLLDDWGREQNRLSLLQWVFDNGDLFPRAEIFGYWKNPVEGWVETQLFVRDLDLMSRWPVYVFTDPYAPPEEGTVVQWIALEHPQAALVEKIPEDQNGRIDPFLKHAAAEFVIAPSKIGPAEFWSQVNALDLS